MMSEAESRSDSDKVETISELIAHLGGLPEPSEDPDVAYIHPGKTWDVIGGGEFTITGYYPEGPADGVVEFQMAGGVHAMSEYEQKSSGASREALEQYEPEDSDRGVMTVNGFMSRVQAVEIGEVDAYSYSDLFWNAVDRGDISEDGDVTEDVTPVTDGGQDWQYTEKGEQLMDEADALEQLASRLRDADSIADDVPVLSRLFHKVRTSGRSGHDGRFVALLDYNADAGEWSCRSVTWLESGTHYRDTGAEATVSYSPQPLLSVDEFSQHVASGLERDATRRRQNAWNYRKEAEDPRTGGE